MIRVSRWFWTRNEKGLAMVLVLFSLVIIAALVTAAFAVTRLDRKASDSARYAASAQNAADAGLSHMYAIWDPMLHSVIPVWDGTPATEWTTGQINVNGDPRVVFVDSLRRLNNELFLVRSFGTRKDMGGNALASITVSQIFRIFKPTIGVNAAITVQSPINFNGNAFLVDGTNSNPAQWGAGECDPLLGVGDDVVGIRSSSSTGVRAQDLDNVTGYPAAEVPNDPTVSSATFQNFLDYTFTTLASQPGVKILPLDVPYNGVAPVATAGVCDRLLPLNLGEPYRNPPTATAVIPCINYFPVVHGTGVKTVFAAGNRGQGTLLVDGDLELNGDFIWVGLIIVRGKVKVVGTGNKITGAVLAEDADVSASSTSTVGGDVEIRYSNCAIQKAVGGASLGRPLGQRSYSQVY